MDCSCAVINVILYMSYTEKSYFKGRKKAQIKREKINEDR